MGAAEHDEEPGIDRGDSVEVVDAGFVIARLDATRGEDGAENAKVLKRDVADDGGCLQRHPQSGSPQPPFSPFAA
jgi:hypothetical protein